MKIKLFTIAASLMLLSFVAEAQTLKIGYVKLDVVYSQWPEAKQADTDLKDFEANFGRQLQAKQQDFQAKLATYQQNAPQMDAVTRQDTEAELQSLQSRLEAFAANAQQSIAQKNVTLVQPLQKKLVETIDQVTKENGFTHVFTYGNSLVSTTDKSGDISAKVAQKLGFTYTEPER